MNVAALPDKGERLRTQVKELEEALESLSLTAATQPGNSPKCAILEDNNTTAAIEKGACFIHKYQMDG